MTPKHQQRPNPRATRASSSKRNRGAPNTRPGRYYKKHEQEDINVFTNFGSNIFIKPGNTVRIFFQNVKGLTKTANTNDYEYYLHNLQQLQVDIAGLAETNTPWNLLHVKSDFLNQVRKFNSISKISFGSPDP
jgi:cell shape-determining protein MreC